MRFVKFFIGVCSVILLSGCIAEEYDYTPPSVTIVYSDIEMIESNIDWTKDEEYKKVTEDILELAKEQPLVSVEAGKEDYLDFDSQDFAIEELTISVWQGKKQMLLALREGKSFNYPSEAGEYVVEVNLISDNGTAQYVANILVE